MIENSITEGTRLIVRDIKKEMESAFIDYSMSVITARALPDVRDGLKPVHRRILYTMHERGNDPSHPTKKSADTVGAVLGSYHPHGDASVYDAMVRLAQDFSLRYPLVEGQGNFGSVDGDPPAAYRYTEARMSRLSVDLMRDIEKNTVDFTPNFDESKQEPTVLPCRIPNLLINGSNGIAVGMATNIPPHNLRVVIEVKREANPQVVLNQLYRFTQLQDTVGVIMLALDKGVPRIMTLKEMMQKYLDFQGEVIRRRTEFDLKKAEERAHILEGLRRAVDIVDEIIAAIRACRGGKPEAKAAVMQQFGFDDPQATAIVNFQLGQLAGLEILKIEKELGELQANIEDLRDILANDARVLAVVEDELNAMREKYGDDRRTEIAHVSGEVDIEDLIPEETCVFTLTHAGYIKRQSSDTYQVQRRGGRGITALSRKDEDFVEELFLASTHDPMLFITDQGRVFRLKGYQIYEGSRTSRGVNIINLLPLQNGEQVASMLRVPDGSAESYLTMVTRSGIIKRTPLSAYANIRKTGLIAISLNEGDSLAWTRITTGSDELILATRGGMAIRIHESDARPMGRAATGVRAIRLKPGDYVVGVGIVRAGATVLTVTEEGKGRRTSESDYRTQYRGGLGIRNYGAKGHVAGLKVIDETDDIILISLEGVIIRMHVADINVQSRYGSGVRVMRLGEGDRVVTVARTEHSDEEETAKPEKEGEAEPTAEELAALKAEETAEAAELENAADETEEDETTN